MSLLQKIRDGKSPHPPRILAHGGPGAGKSTFASQAPHPIFILTEDGVDQINCHSFPLCKTFGEIIDCLSALATEKHDYETVVIDTVDWAERLIFDDLCKQYKVNSIEKVDGGYGVRLM